MSPTIEVLKRYGERNLYEVLTVIGEKMGRLDVTIAVIPLLTDLKKSSEISYGGANFAMVGRSSNSNFSDVASVGSSAIRQQNAINEILEQSQQPIFVTYADDVSDEKLKQLCKNLQKYSNDVDGSAVITQNVDLPARHINNCGWLERTFRSAKHVIVIISPGYHAICSSNSSATIANSSSNSTAFIYNMICTELHSNYGKNLRFRPIIFEEQHRRYVPACLLNTIVYCWPAQHSQMFAFLFGNSVIYSNAKNKMVTM